MKTKSLLYYIKFIAATSMLVACASQRPEYPKLREVPATYKQNSDTSSTIARIPIRSFFRDSLLLGLLDEALRENLEIKKAYQRLMISQAGLRASKGAFLPTVNGVASAAQRRFGDYTMDGIGNYDTNFSDNIGDDKRIPERLPDYYIGVQSTWEIDVWGKLRNARRAAAARVLASEQGRRWLTTRVITEVASLYYDLLSLDNELAIVNKNLLLQERAVEVIKVQKMAGRANELGVRQLTAQVLNTQTLRSKLKQDIAEVEYRMNFMLGRFPQTIERGNPIMEQRLPESLHIGIPAQMLMRRPDVQAAAYSLEAAKADVNAAYAAFFPTIALSASVGLQAFDPSKLFNAGSLAYSLLGGLTAPILNRNQISSQFRISSANGYEAFYEYQQVSIDAYRDVMTNLSRIDNYDSMSRYKTEELQDLNLAVQASNDLFATGFATYLEVIAAQRGALDAELTLAQIRRDQFKAVIDLYRSLGGGWE
ncbi:efflux transporter outer membrane subunit [Chryseolinea sp. T2]|uniref:efflux transporter outer membrane subunit n=1 Tax=Chryseolinea sp. T2 TaxID=3129255 RepID=UPI003077FC65